MGLTPICTHTRTQGPTHVVKARCLEQHNTETRNGTLPGHPGIKEVLLFDLSNPVQL